MAVACGAYIASVFGTFLFSSLSHVFRSQPLLNKMRAWDQAMIYAMIAGTYTPIIYRYAAERTLAPLLFAVWTAVAMGFLFKLALRHRINSIGTLSYLMLGWLPSLPLMGYVPLDLAWWMIAGGVIYTVGVVLLMNDSKLRYLHAAWHVCVLSAAFVHYLAILRFVVGV